MRARALRNLYDFLIGVGGDAPLAQADIIASEVQLHYQLGQMELTMGARRGPRIVATLISTAASLTNSSVEVVVGPTQGVWLRRLVNNAGNYQWGVFQATPTLITALDAEPSVGIFGMNEANTVIPTNPRQVAAFPSPLADRIAFRTGTKATGPAANTQFVANGLDAIKESAPLWIPPGSRLIVDIVAQNTATAVQIDLEFPVRGSEIVG